MQIRFGHEAEPNVEYNCNFRRLYPWVGTVETPWGSAWATIAPGTSTPPHQHDEEETFIIVAGSGEMTIDGQTARVGKGDVIYLPRFSVHALRNTSASENLEMVDIWWGAPSAEAS